MYISKMAERTKLIRLHARHQTLLQGVRRGMRTMLIHQCLDIGILLQERGLLGETGIDMEVVAEKIKRMRI